MNRHRYLPLLLGASLFCAVPTLAQGKKPVAAKKAPAQPSQLPLLLGAAVSGIIIGGALGFALKKTPPPVEETETPVDPLFDTLPIALAMVDGREKIKSANPNFDRFLNVDSAVGRPFPDLIHPDDLANVRTQLHEILGGDADRFARDCRFFRPDGALVHAALEMKKHGKGRKPDAVLVSIQDITQRVEAQSELTGARAAIGALYEVIAGDKSRDLDGKMRSLLSMGCGRFELPIGVMGRFADDCFETLFVQSEDRRVRPAMTLPRGDNSLEARLLGMNLAPT
ncbi:PAS domain S-box protein, partial [bacterium]